MVELHVLLVFMIIGAIVAVEVKDLFSSIVALGGVGLALCMTFLILKAPDIAITQLVVEVLALVILIRATLNRDLPFSISGRWFLNTFVMLIFIVVFLAVAWICLKDLPAFGHPAMKVAEAYLREGLARTGAANIVASVVLDYRAYDTLGEATVLFTAVIGVLAIVRRTGKRKDHYTAEVEDEQRA